MANIIRIKRRAAGGAPGAPASLANAELAFNEVDDVLYYGKGSGGQGGSATTIEAIGGRGAFLGLTGDQSIAGAKTFTGEVYVPTPTALNHAVTKAYVDSIVPNVTAGAGIAVAQSSGSVTISADTTLARVASPVFTGVVTTPAGSATQAGGLKLTTGALKTTPVAADAGGIEFDGVSLSIISNAAARKTVAYTDSNVASATKLATARTINGVAFDGTANISINTSHALSAGAHLTSSAGAFNGSAAVTLAVDATSANTAGKIIARDASGNFSAGTITASLAGNASSASKLQSTRSISASGDATWTVSFDGSADATATLTLKNTGTAGTYAKVTTDAQGRVISGSTLSATDIPTLTAAKISDFSTQVRSNRLDQMAAPAAAVSLNNQRITGLAEPTASTDAATKNYVDLAVQGLDPKASVKVATTGNIAALSGTMTIDGIALQAGDRVLVKDQTTASQNGIYVVNTAAWTRSADADSWVKLVSAYVFVEQGATNADNGYLFTVDAGGTLEATGVSIVQFNGAGQITAGNGLTKTGNQIAVGAGTGIAVATGSVGLTGQALALHSMATNGIFVRTGAGTVAARSIAVSGAGISVANGDGVSGNPTVSLGAALSAVGALTPAADRIAYYSGTAAAALTTLSPFGRSLIDDADAATARATLGLGSMATQNAGAVSITGGSIDNITFDGGTF